MMNAWNVAEKDAFLKFAPKYFNHMEKSANVWSLYMEKKARKEESGKTDRAYVGTFCISKDIWLFYNQDEEFNWQETNIEFGRSCYGAFVL